jgi:hypothetical protein
MAIYLFLPKKVRPPYQTVLFFPSARVDFIADNNGGKALGDVRFFDYIVQSGRAVVYPIYQDTFALLIGLAVASTFQPGRGMNVDPATLDMKSVAQYASDAKHLSFSDFILNIIPDSFGSPFAKGEVLQVLLLTILCGLPSSRWPTTIGWLASANQSRT